MYCEVINSIDRFLGFIRRLKIKFVTYRLLLYNRA